MSARSATTVIMTKELPMPPVVRDLLDQAFVLPRGPVELRRSPSGPPLVVRRPSWWPARDAR